MADETQLARVLGHLGEYLETDVSHLTGQSRLATAIPGLDSMKLFEMVLYLEECFGVEFEDDVMDRLETMDDLAEYIASRKVAGVAALGA
jgi:acyl carrier protein